LLRLQQCYINGKWVSTNTAIDVRDPATGDVIGQTAFCSKIDANAAIYAAHAALPAWSALGVDKRCEYVSKIASTLSNAEVMNDIGTILTNEQGKALVEGRGEIAYAASFFDYFAKEMKNIVDEADQQGPSANWKFTVRHQPVGVVAAITPWNFPAAMIARKAGAALVTGCTFVVKPSELTPFTAYALAEVCHRVGLPKGMHDLTLLSATFCFLICFFVCMRCVSKLSMSKMIYIYTIFIFH
jgi:succinate-semialdehyde dehydrogenase/glutarate-semialdehyde dehydrogenase